MLYSIAQGIIQKAKCNMKKEIAIALVKRPKQQIYFDVSGYSLNMFCYCEQEVGILVFLEGEYSEMNELVTEWQEAGVLLSLEGEDKL